MEFKLLYEAAEITMLISTAASVAYERKMLNWMWDIKPEIGMAMEKYLGRYLYGRS